MSTIKYEKNGNIAVLTIDRPEALNALNREVLRDLSDCIAVAGEDEEVFVLILTGAGRAFVAGADISEMKDLTAVQAKEFGRFGSAVFRSLETLEKPVIAAVNGFALGGGCELALACDIRIAGEKARFGQPETGLGITPGFGGTQRLPRVVGMSMAKELIFTGRQVKADEALRIGLISGVFSQEALMDEALKLAGEIAKNSQTAVRQSKRAMDQGNQCGIEAGLAFEAEAFGLCFAAEDQKNAMTAFMNKSK